MVREPNISRKILGEPNISRRILGESNIWQKNGMRTRYIY